MKSTPRALLCDIDGVLRLWPKDGMAGVDRAHGLPEGTLAATAFHPDLLLPAITGRVSDVQWRESVAEALTDRCGGSEPARAPSIPGARRWLDPGHKARDDDR